MKMEKAALELVNVNKAYGGQDVISGLSFSIGIGERLALFAPSGAGKSTLVRLLAGFEQADSGKFLSGAAMAFQFQEPRLFPFLTVRENILLPYKASAKAPSKDDLSRMDGWLGVAELDTFKDHYPYELSGGMKQKVSFIRAVLGQPAMLVLDEPFQSIGSASKQAMISHLLGTQPGISMLVITHSPTEVLMLATRALVFSEPTLAMQSCMMVEDVEQFFGNYRSGQAAMNLESAPDLRG